MKKITILGGGNMGTGLAHLLAENGQAVELWTIERDVANDINQHHENKKYLPEVELGDGVTATLDLKEAVKNKSLIVVALPTGVVNKVMANAAPHLANDSLFLSVVKGIDDRGRTASQIIKDSLPQILSEQVAVLMGPLFAAEISKKVPSVGLLAAKQEKVFKTIHKVLASDYFFLRWSDDVAGAELAGALKNVYAILMGVSDGLGYGWNTKAATSTAVMRELAEVGHLLGAKKETMYGLAGLGDLLTTSFGETSRNRRFGEMIGQEKSTAAALKKIGQTVEGVQTVEAAIKLLKAYKKQTPLLQAVHQIIHQEADPSAVFQETLKKDI